MFGNSKHIDNGKLDRNPA